MAFELDTSGTVLTTDRSFGGGYIKWSDLSPFVQGYVEALFADEGGVLSLLMERYAHEGVQVRFDDLAPETLARIIADCEGARDGYRVANTKACGASFWAGRNDPPGCWRYLVTDGFPPLTVNLGDDGKVRFA